MGEGDGRRKHPKDVPAAILQASEGQFLKLYHEFINVSIKSSDTARTYKNATTLFLLWCQDNGIEDIIDIGPSQSANISITYTKIAAGKVPQKSPIMAPRACFNIL